MNKYKLYMIISICILVLSIGGSLAWYIWSSSNTYITLGICAPQISFIGGTTLNGDGLKPVTDKSKGLKKQIDVYLNKVCKEGDSAVMNLYMTLDLLPEGLRHETFVYEIWKDDQMLFSSNFKDKTQGQTITLLENQVITENDSIYFVYVYIDGTRDNPSSMSGKSFRFSVYGEGTNAIYKENVIAQPSTPSSSSSVFLNTSIARNAIQTITIAEDNTVPEESQDTAVDISSEGDGSVMLWYQDSNGDGLLDVYMGSENGAIETNTNGQGMFAYLENVESLDLKNLDTSNITNMSSMFQGSKSLKSIELSNFDTSSVTSMSKMFYECSSLTSINLSSFNTSKVTDMTGMFGNCSSLTILDLSNFDTSNVTSMGVTSYGNYGMFSGCSSLTSINLSSFDTSKVTNMAAMFEGCSSLTTLDLSNFDTSNVIYMGAENPSWTWAGMFQGCSSLTMLDLRSFDTTNVITMNRMFFGCSSIKNIIFGDKFNTSNVTIMRGMFEGCNSLASLDVSGFNTSNVTTMNSMFRGCSSLLSLDVSKFNTEKVTDMGGMFDGCSNLTTLDLSKWNTSNVTNMGWMFGGINITNLDLSSFDTSKVTNTHFMFYCSTGIKEIDFSNANFTNITSFSNMLTGTNSELVIKGNEELKTWFATNYSSYADKVEVPTNS